MMNASWGKNTWVWKECNTFLNLEMVATSPHRLHTPEGCKVFAFIGVRVVVVTTMGSPQTTESSYRLCPCGRGHIEQIETEFPNNTFRSSEYSYGIRCAECVQRWNVANSWLEEIVPGDPNAADRAKVERDIEDCCALILDIANLSSPKLEHSLLKSKGLCDLGPIVYKRRRSKGEKISALCKRPFAYRASSVATFCSNKDLAARLSAYIAKKNAIPSFHGTTPKRIRIEDLPRPLSPEG